MNVLHIAKISDSLANGVCVAVPEHIKAQSKTETVALLNLNDYRPKGISNIFVYNKNFSFDILDEPFNKPDIVIFHQVYYLEYIRISKILHKRGIPYIIVPHGSLTVEAQKTKRLKKIIGNLLFSPFVKRASAIQCLSEKELMSSKVKNSKYVGTNGCVIPKKQKQSFSIDKIRFVYIGRLDWHIKGIDILLDAFKLLLDSPYKEKCELRIYGPDYQRQYARVERMISERSLNELVILNFPVFQDGKENVLLESDVFIQTSRTEAMPMGILESLSYGLPCLITEGTALGDYIRNYNAGWVAQTNAQSVFEKIVCAIEEKAALKEKSKNARNIINELFVWEKVAEQNIASYRKFTK